jgi:hypothetical protein
MVKMYACLAAVLITINTGFAQPDASERPPADVIQAAHSQLPQFLKRCIPPQAAGMFGLGPDDDLGRASLGQPYRLFSLSPDAISTYSPGATVRSLLDDSGLWYFPIVLSGRIKLILYVGLKDSVWTKVGLGSAGLACELQRLQARWPSDRSPAILVRQNQLGRYLFSLPQIDEYNLTEIGPSGRLAKGYATLTTLATCIKSLQTRLPGR